jgi:hypothetical protein
MLIISFKIVSVNGEKWTDLLPDAIFTEDFPALSACGWRRVPL